VCIGDAGRRCQHVLVHGLRHRPWHVWDRVHNQTAAAGRPVLAQVPRLQGVVRDRRANWVQSIATLRASKAAGARVTKTSIMLGCGEAAEEVVEAMRLLRDAGAPAAQPLDGSLQRQLLASQGACIVHLC
jgi:lipoate synthase